METFGNLPETLPDEKLANQLAALAHPARLRIMSHLACDDGKCCGDVVSCLELAQSTVSQHLRILVEAGLVRFVRDGQRSRYSVNAEAVSSLGRRFSQFAGVCCAEKGDCCSASAASRSK